jgi:hypothetical protein
MGGEGNLKADFTEDPPPGRAGRQERRESSRHPTRRYAAAVSGGPWAMAGPRPRWVRIFSMTLC